MVVYVAFKCECIHESGYTVLSLHTTKKGAYRACRAWWLSLWNEWNYITIGDGLHGGYNSAQRRREHEIALSGKKWAVQSKEVFDDSLVDSKFNIV